MTRTKVYQKIIFFYDNKSDIEDITQSIKDGWAIVQLIPYGNSFIGVMEKIPRERVYNTTKTVYIPPRKKIMLN